MTIVRGFSLRLISHYPSSVLTVCHFEAISRCQKINEKRTVYPTKDEGGGKRSNYKVSRNGENMQMTFPVGQD